MADKLSRVGLIASRRAKDSTLLGPFLSDYFERRTDVKESTSTNWRHTERSLNRFFGEDRELSSITKGEAQDFERWLRTSEARENAYGETPADSGLSPNTARKRISNAKQFFADAVSRELITRNPFEGLKGSVGGNRNRDYFITREEADKVLEACPDSQWRLLFALSRFGGLRCPSEHLALTWADVDWENNRMRVPSPKTEHHAEGESRMIPIFPELRSHLEEAFEQAEPGTVHVITRYRQANVNLRTQLLKIIKRAGLEAWPKLFLNLRATRETELAQTYPIHVVCNWIGNSQAVATKHYLQVTDEHFEQAAQNAAQSAHVLGGSDSQSESTAQEKTPVLQGLPESCGIVRKRSVGDTGLEQPPKTSGKTRIRCGALQ